MKRLSRKYLFSSEDRSKNLVSKSISAGSSTITEQGAKMLLTLGGTAILARLLSPADYGLIGMVSVVVGLASLFKDAGFAISTVQRKEITEEQISALFWINALISLVLGLCLLGGSHLVALLYSDPRLTSVTAALSFPFIINGLGIQHAALLRRHMRFDSLAVVKVGSQAIGILVTITMALLGWRYWSLVAGAWAISLSTLLLTFYFCPWMPGRIQKGSGIRDMLLFGGHMTVSNFIGYLARNADNFLIGRFIGAESLGLYNRAYSLFVLPITQIRNPMMKVASPVLSSLINEPERYTKYYRRMVDTMATLGIPIALYCMAEAEFIISFFLGEKWMSAVPIFRALSIAGLVQTISGTRAAVLLSFGFSKRFMVFSWVTGSLTTLSFLVGIPYGVLGVAWAFSIYNIISLVPSLHYCFKGTPVKVSMFMKAFFFPLLIGFIAIGTAFIGSRFPTQNSFLPHAVFGFIFSAVYLSLSFFRPTVRDMILMTKKHFSGKQI